MQLTLVRAIIDLFLYHDSLKKMAQFPESVALTT